MIKKRNPWAVALLSLVTLGIYGIVWYVKTKGELVERGGEVPTAWLIIVPFANIYWLYKYWSAAEEVTSGRVKGRLFFLISIALGAISLIMTYVIDAPANDTANIAEPASASPVTVVVQLIGVLAWLSIVAYTQSSYNRLADESPAETAAPGSL